MMLCEHQLAITRKFSALILPLSAAAYFAIAAKDSQQLF